MSDAGYAVGLYAFRGYPTMIWQPHLRVAWTRSRRRLDSGETSKERDVLCRERLRLRLRLCLDLGRRVCNLGSGDFRLGLASAKPFKVEKGRTTFGVFSTLAMRDTTMLMNEVVERNPLDRMSVRHFCVYSLATSGVIGTYQPNCLTCRWC